MSECMNSAGDVLKTGQKPHDAAVLEQSDSSLVLLTGRHTPVETEASVWIVGAIKGLRLF